MPQISLPACATFIVLNLISFQIIKKEYRWISLLVTSLLILAAIIGQGIVLLMALSSLIYVFGRYRNLRAYGIVLPLLVLLSPVILNKWFNSSFQFNSYFGGSQDESLFGWTKFLAVLGLSYFTFNGLSYLMDIRRGFARPELNFFRLLLFLLYFPAISSGPLNRANSFFRKLKNLEVTEENLGNGFRLILWGLFKNLVIAQGIKRIISGLEPNVSGIAYLLVGFLFFFYLYVSFSSYINVFQGISGLFGLPLNQNFANRIYASSTRQRFWKGWHITLNEWFRDYYFFEFVKGRKSAQKINLLLFSTFLLTALWHDLSVVFLIWGVLNASWILIEKELERKGMMGWAEKRPALGTLYHLFFVAILSTVFITPTLAELGSHFTGPPEINISGLGTNLFAFEILATAGCFLIMDYHERKAGGLPIDRYFKGLPGFWRWCAYYLLIALIFLLGNTSSLENYYNQF